MVYTLTYLSILLSIHACSPRPLLSSENHPASPQGDPHRQLAHRSHGRLRVRQDAPLREDQKQVPSECQDRGE